APIERARLRPAAEPLVGGAETVTHLEQRGRIRRVERLAFAQRMRRLPRGLLVVAGVVERGDEIATDPHDLRRAAVAGLEDLEGTAVRVARAGEVAFHRVRVGEADVGV